MKNKIFLLVGLVPMMLSSCAFSNTIKKEFESISLNALPALTMVDAIQYYEIQNEHYPCSDSFIEKYQQTSGGYLDYAKKQGVLVDKYQHSPNQKWHFLSSWFDQSLEDKSITWNADAKKRIYTGLLCPELLLWIFEAGGVNPSLVREAMKVAEAGKSAGTTTSAIAKNMKEIVSFDDIETNIRKTAITPIPHIVKYKADTEGVIVTGLSPDGYMQGETVNFNITGIPSDKELDQVTVDDATIIGNINDGFSFTMPNHYLYLHITLKEKAGPKIINLPESISIKEKETTTLTPALSEGIGTFTFTTGDSNIATVSEEGLVSGVKAGNTSITVICNENPSLTQNIPTKIKSSETKDFSIKYSIVYDLGTKKTATQIEDATTLKNTFSKVGTDESIINSTIPTSCIFGGANGGRSETAWLLGNILKIGTTSVDGDMTLELSSQINKVKITGYISATNCKVRLGNSSSTDWVGEAFDNKTKEYTIKATDMTVIDKEQAEAGNVSTIEFTFDSTDSLRIKTTSTTSTKKVLYITAIEFIYDSELEK